MGIVMAIVMLVSIPLHTMIIGASELPPPPHFVWNVDTPITYAWEGDEIVVSFEMEFLTSQGWTSTHIFIDYDSDVLELIPFGFCQFFLSGGLERILWFEGNIHPWYWSSNVLSSIGSEWYQPGQISFIVMSSTADLQHPIRMSFRFRVRDHAPSGITTISWNPLAAISTGPRPGGTWGMDTLTVVQPTDECFLDIMILSPGSLPPPPHFVWNAETPVSSAVSGDEIVVSFEMEFLTSQGWGATQIFVDYDSDVLELIPYGYCPFFLGVGVERLLWFDRGPWYGGSNVISNIGGYWYQPGRISFIVMSSFMDIPYPITMSFRFRVRDNAPSGMTTVSWEPLHAISFGPRPDGTWVNENLTVVQPTEDCFVHVMINQGEWINEPGVGWVFEVAGNKHMGWLVWEGDRFFMNPANGGAMVTSPTMYIDGEFHTFNPDGRWQGELGYIDGDWENVPGVGWVFNVEATGLRHSGWLRWEGQVFRVSPAMVSNGTVLIDGVWHQFNSAGWWLGSL